MGLIIRLTKIKIMDYQTDYVRQRISDPVLRDLLIKSRKGNTYVPVYYNGKKYWCLEELTEEQQAIGRNKAIKEILILGSIAFALNIVLMYVLAIYMPQLYT